MSGATLASILLSSTDPDRLGAWYAAAVTPADDARVDTYRILRYGDFHLMIDQRDDVGPKNPEPGRIILNFDVDDARAVVARLDEMGATWLSPLEDRDGSLFATAVDPDGTYVQFIQISAEHRAQLASARDAT
ncbi:VOC family protein [Jiangella mangrovi]|uniref:Putative enzyme related to lactoylglutathione lyase n=1 Tax=Jiangella mangrovi TaxID=1524084 RepID=A0A7W9GLF7_9ACTN|nr:VOC family protein [Jiangella mangrovi]MBB5786034.1 putative enzyme related to lactoylglutathione lyase [Jiangella mangrovi]